MPEWECIPTKYTLTTMWLIRMHAYPAKARYAALDVDQPRVARACK